MPIPVARPPGAEEEELILERFDTIVIGAGQGGGPLAGAFARAGRKTALVERAHAGGTCVNEGCTPTKTMVASARVAHLARRAADYGVATGPVNVNLAHVRERKRRIVESFRNGSARALSKAGVRFIMGQARFTGGHTLSVETEGGEITMESSCIVINVGQRPAVPALPGLDAVSVLNSTSIMELDEVPEHLVVLGGGYVGLEFAQMFRRFGAEVTLIARDHQLLVREDADVAAEVLKMLEQDGIRVLLGIRAERLAADNSGMRLSVRDGGGTAREIAGSRLLVAVGRTPNSGDLGLDRAGVATDARGYVQVDDRLETSVAGVYAIGDVTGGPAFTHWAYDDFRILRDNLIGGGNRTTRGRILPYAVYTDPQLGRVGITEQEARARGLAIRVARLPMTRVARALETDEVRGFLKAVVDARTDRILGAAVLGTEGGELATMFQLAMLGNLPYTTLRDGIFAHPSFAESLNNLFTAMERAEAA
jgi:pyruvate/2-oxoglutarate dehydrogenase complex dihydrolipoamide dehydrogenase (E3) component